ncbi:MarR family winged helix-turn-helix transcriptional regulator [Kitasatospora sp. NPDC056446]|uniref:MarR family winged helix-turn-helix transcriptional regulator n=1 Tax=Kitasatospora sp. NPDC056446 TaxID=3345819 RepID=UPI0036C1D34E
MTTVSRERGNDIELWWQVSRLSTYVSQLLERRLMRSHGIGLTDFIALSTMQQSEPRMMQMQELADEMGVNQSTLSRVAVRLERSGLVKRAASEHDRRFVVIRLTDVGRRELELYSATFSQELHTAFEMAALSPVLSTFLARIRPGE